MDTKEVARINSLVKAFGVIETLSQKPEWELAELSNAVALPKTTVHRLITTLEDLGFVRQEKRRGSYALTSKLFQLGSRVVNHGGLVDLARPMCQRLQKEIGETVNFCIPQETEMLVLDIQVANHPLRQDTRVGVGFAMSRSASGRAYLGVLNEPERSDLLRKIKREEKIPLAEWNALMDQLEKVRQSGIGYDNEEIFPGVRCVASPVFDHTGQVIATISISAPVFRLDDEMLHNVALCVGRTAAEISQRLGAPVARRSRT